MKRSEQLRLIGNSAVYGPTEVCKGFIRKSKKGHLGALFLCAASQSDATLYFFFGKQGS